MPEPAGATRALARASQNAWDDHGSWTRSARLRPHVLALAQHSEGTKELGRLLTSAGSYLSARAQFSVAREVLERALEIFETAYGPDIPRWR